MGLIMYELLPHGTACSLYKCSCPDVMGLGAGGIWTVSPLVLKSSWTLSYVYPAHENPIIWYLELSPQGDGIKNFHFLFCIAWVFHADASSTSVKLTVSEASRQELLCHIDENCLRLIFRESNSWEIIFIIGITSEYLN